MDSYQHIALAKARDKWGEDVVDVRLMGKVLNTTASVSTEQNVDVPSGTFWVLHGIGANTGLAGLSVDDQGTWIIPPSTLLPGIIAESTVRITSQAADPPQAVSLTYFQVTPVYKTAC